jgi:hypothetical protein
MNSTVPYGVQTPVEAQAALVPGYYGGACVTVEEGKGKITLHYETDKDAERAYVWITDIIDRELERTHAAKKAARGVTVAPGEVYSPNTPMKDAAP